MKRLRRFDFRKPPLDPLWQRIYLIGGLLLALAVLVLLGLTLIRLLR